MTLASHDLRPVDRSDQRLPCSVIECRAKARFVLTPSCAHDESSWPTRQACSGHLAPIVRIASGTCKGHVGGRVVRVRPL